MSTSATAYALDAGSASTNLALALRRKRCALVIPPPCLLRLSFADKLHGSLVRLAFVAEMHGTQPYR